MDVNCYRLPKCILLFSTEDEKSNRLRTSKRWVGLNDNRIFCLWVNYPFNKVVYRGKPDNITELKNLKMNGSNSFKLMWNLCQIEYRRCLCLMCVTVWRREGRSSALRLLPLLCLDSRRAHCKPVLSSALLHSLSLSISQSVSVSFLTAEPKPGEMTYTALLLAGLAVLTCKSKANFQISVTASG